MNIERELLIRTLMAHPNSDELVPFRGEHMPIHEVLKILQRGGDGATVHEASAQPSGGSAIEPSTEAADALNKPHRDVLMSGEGIEGLTVPHRTRVHAEDRGTGHTEIRIARNESSGRFERAQGEFSDTSGFFAPTDLRRTGGQ